jgi:hypothetical protein
MTLVRGVALLALALVACASEGDVRAPVDTQSPLQGELGFLLAAEAGRGEVETRLGEPAASFEAGRIVSYAVRYDGRRLVLVPDSAQARSVGAATGCFGLMIEYSTDGRIVRHALIRHGSARCPKEELL